MTLNDIRDYIAADPVMLGLLLLITISIAIGMI